jgi:DNA primase
MNARKCRNWQTSKTKDLVSIALVWVQVPSSAFIIRKGLSFIWKFFFVSISIIPQYIIIHEKVNKKRKKLKESKKFCRIIIMRRFKMYYSDEIIEEVRSRNDIVDVISTYVKLQKKGSSYFGLCPFHNEKSPSFSVSRQKQMYYCFGCGAGGNVFTFLMEYENYTFVEALKYLADRAGVELPEEEYSREAKERADTRAILLEINKAAAQYYYIQLKSSRGAVGLEYFKKRKLSDETIKAFGLGYSNKYSDDLYRYLKSKGYKDDMIAKAGLISIDEKNGVYDKFWNRVMFPIMDVNSRVIGFGGRVMGDAKPKYLNSPETMIFDKSRNLYGLNRARRTKKPYFLLCEGYMDVISLHQAGFTNAVASLGTALTPGHAALIHRYVQEVYLTYDSDGAGTRAALRAMPILRDAGITAKIIRMEPYKDPDEFIKNLGAEAFEERIASARNVFMYSLEVLEKDYDMNSPEGKTEFMKETARRLTQFEEEIERNNYIEAVAKAYHVGFEELRKLVGKMAVQTGLAKPAERPREIQNNRKNKKEDGILVSQKVLLTWLIESEEIFHQIEKYITPEDFSEGLFRKVAELLYEQYEKHEANPAQIMNHFTDEEEHREVAGLFHTKIKELTTVKEQEKALQETILRVKEHSIEEATKNLDPTDIQGLQRLMNEKRKMQDLRTLHISIN